MKLSIMGSVVVWMGASVVVAQEAMRETSQVESTQADQSTAGQMQPGTQAAQQAREKPDTPTKKPKTAKLPQRDDAWWSEQTCAWIGTIGGPVCGLLGGLLGGLGGCGKARRFVLTLTAASAGLGVVSLIIGVIALVLRQPWAVYFPLLLFGVVSPVVLGPNFFVLRWAYEQRELRKMAAMDTR
jgi:hypothetical protein